MCFIVPFPQSVDDISLWPNSLWSCTDTRMCLLERSTTTIIGLQQSTRRRLPKQPRYPRHSRVSTGRSRATDRSSCGSPLFSGKECSSSLSRLLQGCHRTLILSPCAATLKPPPATIGNRFSDLFTNFTPSEREQFINFMDKTTVDAGADIITQVA